jgi:ubiquinone/menaquinone biosynthesis C-methylase UbiE
MIVDLQNREEGILVGLIKPKGKRILEIGCGEGRVSFLLAKHAENYLAIDSSVSSINKAISQITPKLKKRIDFEVAFAAKLPLPAQSVDVVFMMFSFHEISVQEQGIVLIESLRVLKSGGKIIIVDPEAVPVGSVMELDCAVHSKLKYFDHSVIVNHSKQVIKKIVNDFDLEVANERYDINWQFDDFGDLKNSIIADFPEINWDNGKRIIVADIIRGIIKDKEFAKPIIIPDHMEVTIISKKNR